MRKLNTSIIVAICLSAISFSTLAGKIYSCKSASGKMVFQDKPCTNKSQQIDSRAINSKHSSGETINEAICRKSIENIHKYLMPKLVEGLSTEQRQQLVQKNINQCMQQHTEKDYQEILCFSRASSAATAGQCVNSTK